MFFFISFLMKDEEFLKGEKLFESNCLVCHKGGNNVIIPEKGLKKEALKTNGINNLNGIVYQIINGKNGMPAFGRRLSENDIEQIAFYILQNPFENY